MNRGGDILNDNLAGDVHTSGKSKQSQPPPNISKLMENSYRIGLSSSGGGQLNMTAVEPALPAVRAQAWRGFLPCWDSESSSGTKTRTNSAAEADAAANERDRRKQPPRVALGFRKFWVQIAPLPHRVCLCENYVPSVREGDAANVVPCNYLGKTSSD